MPGKEKLEGPENACTKDRNNDFCCGLFVLFLGRQNLLKRTEPSVPLTLL